MNTIEILESLEALILHGYIQSMVQGLEEILLEIRK